MSKRVRLLLISISGILIFYIVIGGLLGEPGSPTTEDETYRDLGVYSEVLSRINQDYVTQPNLKKVTKGAIRGLLEALDPYSTYFTPKEYQDYLQHPQAGPAGIGIFISKRWGYATVVSILPGSPAEKAGVKVGDLIDRINDAPTRNRSAVQLERLMEGAPGSELTLAVVREPRTEPQSITITRAVLVYPPVTGKMVQDQVGYIRVPDLTKGKSDEIAAKVKSLMSQGAEKIVLDLRDCAGGDYNEAVKAASLFMDNGSVGYLEGQHYERKNFSVTPGHQICKLPLAVLINQSTAGPAELLASAILDDKRGEVVGVRSFGVGVYQQVIPVGDGSALLLSVAKYYTPDGKAIQDNGVTPNVIQQSTAENSMIDTGTQSEQPENFGGKGDLQLQKAIETLNAKTSQPKAA